jgi:ribosomal protein S1
MDKFNLEEIDKTFTSYKKGQIFDGVVVTKRPDGLIFNIGGKNDAFIPVSDFDSYDDVKIGERFKVVITKQKNEEGLIEASKRDAQELIVGTQNAQKLKLGSRFSFVATSGEHGLHSKMGEYEIFVPMAEISSHYIHNTKDLVGKQFEAVVTEYDKENKKIIASIKLLQEQVREQCENLFWNSIFINKVVTGKVKKILPYGIFVDVDGVDCFCHISNLSYEKVDSPDKVVKEGETLQFKVIELDRENKKVALGLKQLQESPREKAIKEIVVGETYTGEVIKLLAFGAIIKLENGATGLLHISNATENKQKNIYEIVRVGDKVQVEVIDKDEDNQKLSFKLIS